MCDVISSPLGSPPLVSVTIMCDWLSVPRTMMVMVKSYHVFRCTRSHRRPPHTSCCLTSFLRKSTCHVEVQCHEPNLSRDRAQARAPKSDPLKSRRSTKPSDLDYPRAKFFQTKFFELLPRWIGYKLRAKSSHVSITVG